MNASVFSDSIRAVRVKLNDSRLHFENRISDPCSGPVAKQLVDLAAHSLG